MNRMNGGHIAALHLLLLLLSCSTIRSDAATNDRYYYVATDGSDDSGNGGSLLQPFATIERCAEVAGGVDGATVCALRGGVYEAQENVIRNAVNLTIAPAFPSNETVVFDGTIELTNPNWSYDAAADAWRADVSSFGNWRPWQLFYSTNDDGEDNVFDRVPIGLARWPDAQPWSVESYDREAHMRYVGPGTDQGTSSGVGTIADDPVAATDGGYVGPSLADLGISFQGCVGVLNIGHWKTMASIVTDHAANEGVFNYSNPECGTSCPGTAYNDDGKGRFYFVGCEAALVSTAGRNEWTYTEDFSQILWRPPQEISDPNNVRVRGKNTTWTVVLADSTQVNVRDVTFWGTTMGIWKNSADETVGVDNTVEDCVFEYPVASRRSVREVAETTPDAMTYYSRASEWGGFPYPAFKFYTGAPTFVATRNRCVSRATLRNNVVRYTDGNALHLIKSGDDVIDNNLFRHIDFSPVGNAFTIDGQTTCGKIQYTRNTIDTAGASAGFRVGTGSADVAFNYHTNMGLCQYDGASVQAGKQAIPGTVYQRNWIMDTDKLALRFDSGERADTFGWNGTMIFNVAIRALNGLQIKGFNHMIANNLGFGSTGESSAEDSAAELSSGDARSDFTVKRCWPCGDAYPPEDFYCNNDTRVLNNAGGISADGAGYEPMDWLVTPDADVSPVPLLRNNYNDWIETLPVESLLRDANNLDFRPRYSVARDILIDQGEVIPGVNDDVYVGAAPDIGAYEYGDARYWIPGQMQEKASMPIPPHGTTSSYIDADLMFLRGKDAVGHRLYLDRVDDNGAELTLRHVFDSSPDDNIYTPPGLFEPGATYRWRVDVVKANGDVVTGDVWTFTPFDSISETSASIADTYFKIGTEDAYGDLKMMRVRNSGSGMYSFLRTNNALRAGTSAVVRGLGCSVENVNATLHLGVFAASSGTDTTLTDITVYALNGSSSTTWTEASTVPPAEFDTSDVTTNRAVASLSNVNITSHATIELDVSAYVVEADANGWPYLAFALATTDSAVNRKIDTRECTNDGCVVPQIVIRATYTCPATTWDRPCAIADRDTLRAYVEFVNAGNASSIPDAACATADMSEWNVGEVTSLDGVFQDMTNIGFVDLSGWETSRVTSMNDMFYGASNFNANLSAFDTSRVTSMANAFRGAGAFVGVGVDRWDVSNVTDFESAFRSAGAFNGDISEWTTSKVTNLARAFYGATTFNADVSGLDVSLVTSLMSTFRAATAFDRDLSAWPVTSQLVNMQHAFRGATSFRGANGMSAWDTSEVTIMKYAFDGCMQFNGDITGWSVERVTNFDNMFSQASAFDRNISRWELSSAVSTENMFTGADALDDCLRANIYDAWGTYGVIISDFASATCNIATTESSASGEGSATTTTTTTTELTTAQTPVTTSSPAPTPAPTPVTTSSPAPTPAPTPVTTSSPAPTPAPTPVTTSSPAPTPAPTPVTTSSPAPTPAPTPVTTSSPAPTPAPTPVTTSSPAPTPAPTPVTTSLPAPTPAPTPVTTSSPAPTPAPTPVTTSSPAPTPAPTPVTTSLPAPTPTPVTTPLPSPTLETTPAATSATTSSSSSDEDATETSGSDVGLIAGVVGGLGLVGLCALAVACIFCRAASGAKKRLSAERNENIGELSSFKASISSLGGGTTLHEL